jgi:hypothetical protein
MLCVRGEAAIINYIVFALTQPGQAPTIYHNIVCFDPTRASTHDLPQKSLCFDPTRASTHDLPQYSLCFDPTRASTHNLVFALTQPGQALTIYHNIVFALTQPGKALTIYHNPSEHANIELLSLFTISVNLFS